MRTYSVWYKEERTLQMTLWNTYGLLKIFNLLHNRIFNTMTLQKNVCIQRHVNRNQPKQKCTIRKNKTFQAFVSKLYSRLLFSVFASGSHTYLRQTILAPWKTNTSTQWHAATHISKGAWANSGVVSTSSSYNKFSEQITWLSKFEKIMNDLV